MTNPYRTFGAEPAGMLGREALFKELTRHLTKATPDHVSVVGPRHFGKSVILRELGRRFSSANEYYLTSVYWDLRHGTPLSDEMFLRSFAVQLENALQTLRPDYTQYLKDKGEGIQDLIDLLFDDLEGEGKRLLVILDGFDHLHASPEISRNLWDTMRSFAQRSSLRLVTGSRGRLRELCRSEDSRTSDFWEIFYDTPISVRHFEEEDWAGLTAPLGERGISLEGSAEKELRNWTGGVPLLAAALLRKLWESKSDGMALSKPDIDSAAQEVLSFHQELLEALWDDCSADIHSDLVQLAECQEMPAAEIPAERFSVLEAKGFVRKSGNRIKPSCRFVEKFAETKAGGVANLQRLFGDQEGFSRNIRGFLELRLAQVIGGDPELMGYVQNAIRHLHPEPKSALVWSRRIAECALDLVWRAELPADLQYPREWVSEWQHTGETLPRNSERLPRPRGAQCNVLRLITGTQNARRVSRWVTKPTYLLIDHVQAIGDFGQHQDDKATVSFAAAFCLAAIELCDSLARDLSP